MPNAVRHIWSQYNKLFFSVFKMACHQMTNAKKKQKFHKCNVKRSSNHRRSSIRELPRILRNLTFSIRLSYLCPILRHSDCGVIYLN